MHPIGAIFFLRPEVADVGHGRREVVMNLEQLRKQAKELVKAARSGDPEAVTRLGGREPILARAQLVIAREHGYASWPALVAASEANADEFVLAATGGRRRRAEAILAARPEIERDPWARLVLGRGWDGDANAAGGPRGWAPILYVSHSCFGSAALVGELLARGADPNAFFVNEYGRMSALYGRPGSSTIRSSHVSCSRAERTPTTTSRSTTRRRRKAPNVFGSCWSTAQPCM
jgi:hypothetical protein